MSKTLLSNLYEVHADNNCNGLWDVDYSVNPYNSNDFHIPNFQLLRGDTISPFKLRIIN